MAYPKITYTDASGNPQAFQFQLPPRNKPYAWGEAQRTDTIAQSGIKRTVFVRIDNFLAMDIQDVELGDEVAAWDQFMTFANRGGEFIYYPDGDVPDVSTTCTLEDTTWKPEFQYWRHFKFSLTFRVAVS